MKDDKHKKSIPIKNKDVADITICKSTAQMIVKARKDGVETAFDRAANMKPCPIGAKSACCKHCAMGPCRINANDPYAKVGICGATIDTMQSRNLARMVACGTAAHVSHGRNTSNLMNTMQGVVPTPLLRKRLFVLKTANSRLRSPKINLSVSMGFLMNTSTICWAAPSGVATVL